MAVTKRFNVLHSLLVTDKTNDIAQEAGVLAVKAIYSGDDAEMVLALLNDTPQFIRKAFASWFRKYDVLVNDPEIGTAAYTVGNELHMLVKDKSKQTKIFAVFSTGETADVLKQEMKVAVAKKVKALAGTPQSRASKKIASMVAAMKKEGDEDGAAYLNDKFTANVNAPKTIVGSAVKFGVVFDGEVAEMTKEEGDSLCAYLMQLRLEAKQAERLAA